MARHKKSILSALAVAIISLTSLSLTSSALDDDGVTLAPAFHEDYWRFGTQVAIDGDYAVVGAGAQYTGVPGTREGAAHIFKRDGNTWTEVKRIQASDAQDRSEYGQGVGIDGDTVVVGAYRHDGAATDSGRAYVYQRDEGGIDNFGEVKILSASDEALSDSFGRDVDIEGNYIVVGAHINSDAGFGSGSAYIFERDFGGTDNWGERKKLVASDAAASDFFGYSVAISSDLVLIGAYGDDDGADFTGSAYVFRKDFGGVDNWGQAEKLNAGDPEDDDNFGWDVDIDGDTAIIGTPWSDDTFAASGSGYIFEHAMGDPDTWSETKKLVASTPTLVEAMGSGVGISGDVVILGAYRDTSDSLYGSAYIFSRDSGGADNWGEIEKISPDTVVTEGEFGIGAHIDGDYAIVGAWKFNPGDRGNAYIFKLDAPHAPVNVDATSFTGTTATLTWDDNADETSYDIYQATTNVQPGSSTYSPAADATSQAVTGLSTTLPNYFWISATNSYGEGDTTEICLRYTANANKILACDGTASDEFGYSVDISGDYAVVGARRDTDNGTAAGAAYIFVHNEGGWAMVKKIVGSDTDANDEFGFDVAIEDDLAFVGANLEDGGIGGINSGAVYVFQRDLGGREEWGELVKVEANDESAGNQFGYSVDATDGFLIVGAPEQTSGEGSAYIFTRDEGGFDNWGQIKKLTASDAASFDFFGRAVSILDDIAVVGGNNANAAYVFEQDFGGADNWGERTILTGSDTVGGDGFGTSVDRDADHILVGAAFHNSAYGAAYLFERNDGGADNWGEIKKFAPEVTYVDGEFGKSVSIVGDNVVIGSDQTFSGIDWGVGHAHIFEKDFDPVAPGIPMADNWGLVKVVTHGTLDEDYFGLSVATNGTEALIGASRDDELASNAGAAFSFPLIECGNSIIEPTETCDDGNTVSSDGCSASCQSETCGDGIIQSASETCDDANSDDGDGCSSSCLQEICTALDSVTILASEEIENMGSGGEQFGYAVDISGALAIIAHQGDSPEESAHIYENVAGSWTFVKTLKASDMAGGYSFTVAIDGGTAAVGTGGGEVYIYGKDEGGTDNWGEIVTFDTGFDSYEVDLSNGKLVVGSPSTEATPGVQTGGGYVYEKDFGGANNWGLRATLLASDGVDGDSLGYSAGISGDNVILGDFNKDGGIGAAYIFSKDEGGTDNWGEVKKLSPSDGVSGDQFGWSSSISGDNAVVGSYFHPATGGFQGAAYVYNKDFGGADNWGEIKKLTASTPEGNSFYGWSVAIKGNIINVGAWMADSVNFDGRAFLYEKDTGGTDNWGELAVLDGSDSMAGDGYGWWVGIADAYAVVGTSAPDKAYFYDIATCVAPATTGGGSPSGGNYSVLTPDAPVGRSCDTPKTIDLPKNLAVQTTGGGASVNMNWEDNNLAVDSTIEVLRNGLRIATLDSDATNFTDSEVPTNTCRPGVAGGCRIKDYEYTLRTRNACGDRDSGAPGTAFVNPEVPAGVEIDVTADISIVVKEGFNEVFEDRLEDLTELSATQVMELDENACSNARNAYFASEKSRANRNLAAEYIRKCFDPHMSDIEIDRFVTPLIFSRMSASELEIAIESKLGGLNLAENQVTTYFQGLNTIDPGLSFNQFRSAQDTSLRDQVLCGGKEANACTTDDKERIEAFFGDSSHARNILVEVEDDEGNATITPLQTRTDIFGQAHNVDLGTFISGKEYKIKVTLMDEQFVLPKILTITINNPVPTTVGGVTTFSTHLDLKMDDEFCFGDFEEDGDIDLNDIFELKSLVQDENVDLFEIWDAINLDGQGGFDLLDMVSFLKNFQCDVNVHVN